MSRLKRAAVVTVDSANVSAGELLKLNDLVKAGTPGIGARFHGDANQVQVVIDKKIAPQELIEGSGQEKK